MEGKVKFFNETKGFGFIKEAETGKEYFVHITGVNGGNTLNQDDDVSFDLVEGKKGLNAVNVELI
jgi:cold shock protein